MANKRTLKRRKSRARKKHPPTYGGGLSLSAANEILKKIYLPGLLNDLHNSQTLYDRLRDQPHEITGQPYSLPLRLK